MKSWGKAKNIEGGLRMKTYQIKKSIITSLILLLFYLLIITTSTVLAEETTIYVDDVSGDDGLDNPSENYTSIQDAINNATGGETIYVYNGIYAENISINKQINVSGESIEGVVVNGQFTVENNDTLIEMMTISNVTSGGDFPSAIFDTSTNSIFTNLKLVNNTYGIFLSEYSYGNIISNNLIENNDVGIYINNFGELTAPTINDITIMDNKIDNNYEYGIHIENSNNNTIRHNRILNNVETGIYYLNAEDNLIYDNYFDNENNAGGEGNNIWNISLTDNIDGRDTNIIGGEWFGGNYWSDYTGNDADSDGTGDTNYTSGTITDWYPLTYNYNQIFVDNDAEASWYDETHVHSIFEAVEIANEFASIFVHNGTYDEAVFIDKSVHILGESTLGVICNGSEIWYDNDYFFNINSNNVSIENLTVSNVQNYEGVGDFNNSFFAIRSSSDNTHFSNLRLINNDGGISLFNSKNTSISGNFIQLNYYGISFQNSSNNIIFNNYFVNLVNVQYVDGENINSWNVSKTLGSNIIGGPYIGGNYWNNYMGIDNNSDGIGDYSYDIIPESSEIDYFPLTMYFNVSNSTPSNGSLNIEPGSLTWSADFNYGYVEFLPPINWSIECSNGQKINGTSLPSNLNINLTELKYGTTYTIWVNVTGFNLSKSFVFTFTTKDKPQEEKKEEPINRPPIARPGGPYTSFPNGQIPFDGSSSSDPDGYITSYTWTFGDGNSATGETCTHSYSNEGTYTITLTVIDNKEKTGSSTTTAVIVKPNNPPEIQSSIDYDHDKLTVQLSLTVTDADGDDISCTINWDDSTSTSLSLTSGESATQSHTYSAYGLYSIQITANDGSTDTSKTHTFLLFTEENKEKVPSSGFFGFLSTNSENESFLENQIDGRSLFGNAVDKKYVIPAATAASIILLFLFNFLIEFFSDYSSEHALDFRKDKKDKTKKNKKRSLSSHKYLNKRELLSILVTTLLLSFVLTWTWVSDFSVFIELFLITLFIVALIFLIRESLRSYLCHKQNIQSEFYVWPLGSVMMIVSTVIGNTFSLAANHHYDEKGDIKKCGRVNFIVSLFMYLVVLSAFITNLIYPSIVLQMIVIVSILNLFIDLFPFRPMDGYELRQWNLPIWAVMYVLVFISYVVVYFNLFP